MTGKDIEMVAQCLVALRSFIDRTFTEDDMDRMIDRFLWAIHAGKETPKSFRDGNFRERIRNGSPLFPRSGR